MEHDIPNAFQDSSDHKGDFDHAGCGMDENCDPDLNGTQKEDEATKNSSRARKTGRYCVTCSQSFETREAYRTHLKTSNLHLLCPYCDFDCISRRTLRLHKQKHSDSKHYFCERCDLSFESEGHRRLHWASSDAHKNTYCKLCKIDFEDSGKYAAHAPKPGANCGSEKTRQDGSQAHGHNENEKAKAEKGGTNESGGRGKFGKDGKSHEHDRNSNSKGRKQNPRQSRAEDSKKKKAESSKSRSSAAKAPPNHYAMLGIPSNSSVEEIIKASKKRRIEVHPDRTKRQEGLSAKDLEALDTEAMNVGFAAEVLSDEMLRRRYDDIYRLWY